MSGWNALHFSATDADPALVDPLDIPLSTNQLPTLALTLSGTWAASEGPDGYGIFAAPYALFIGGSVNDWLYDAPAEADWSITFEGEPDDDHFTELDFLSEPGALEVPLAYVDLDGSGSFDLSDAPAFAACQDDVPVGALWLPSPTDLGLALSLASQGIAPGWLALTLGDGEGLPDPDRLDALVISESCVIE